MDPVNFVLPRRVARDGTYPDALRAIVDVADIAAARTAIAAWPGYAPTPMVEMPHLASALEVGRLRIKHEGHRFAVGSFKALGPPYALQRAMARRGGSASGFTAIAATSGNHGRALAWGAARLGARSRIFMPEHTSAGREKAISAFGADVIRVPGNFDAALAAAQADAAAGTGRILVADAECDGADMIARDILAGYAVLACEIADSCAAAPPSHVFVAAGNGTLAAATAAGLWLAYAARRPTVVVAEPDGSDCLRRSLAAGDRVTLADAGRSVMDGLVVGAPSAIAWPIQRAGVDAAATVDDGTAVATLRRLAAGADGDPPLEIGETGIAAVAALARVCGASAARAAIGIGADSDVVVIACEGVTDKEVFDRLRG